RHGSSAHQNPSDGKSIKKTYDSEDTCANIMVDVDILDNPESPEKHVVQVRSVADQICREQLAATSSIRLDWSNGYKDPLLGNFLRRFLSERYDGGQCQESAAFSACPRIACKLAMPIHDFLTTAVVCLYPHLTCPTYPHALVC
ncbi:MAG: hypothetical protein ACRYGR_02175, partial [Janthinobacterium lividum]